MATKKAATSYRLSDEARAAVDRWAGRLGLSDAAVVDAALRAFDDWLDRAPLPAASITEHIKAAVLALGASAATGAADEPKKPRGRPRKKEGGK